MVRDMTTNKVQVNRYMKFRQEGRSQEESASRVGISSRTARTIEHGKHTSQVAKKPRTYRTRKSKVTEIWESELLPMLIQTPQLTAITLYEHLQDKYPDQFNGSLRSLQRYVKEWKTLHRESSDVVFQQVHHPGMQAFVDFTVLKGVTIVVDGQIVPFILFHFP